MNKVPCRVVATCLIFMQLCLPVWAYGPDLDRRDPMSRYQTGSENMRQGALMGAAVYFVSKILGQAIGDYEFSKYLREQFPFMSYFIPPSGWLGWKEEVLNLAGYSTLGAGVASFGSGGLIAQQFQMGMSDAMSHWFLSEVATFLGNDDFDTEVPFIDMVMVKTASQIIRDELIPAGVPPFRGRTSEILVLNSAVEISAYAVIGAVEGAAMAALYTEVRENEVELGDFFRRQMKTNAWTRGLEAFQTVVMLGPRVHVSKSERAKIQAYADARGVDVKWALDHAQFRDGHYMLPAHDSYVGDNVAAFVDGRHVVIREKWDPANSSRSQQVGAHEAAHIVQGVETPDWVYLRMRHPEFRAASDLDDHDSRIFEIFPETYLE